MITETLSLLCGSDLISDSALKVVFSYYPVCRCQRTSPDLRRGKPLTYISDHKKTQSRLRLELGLLRHSVCGRSSDKSCRDKIEFQFAVPECT